VDLAADTVGEEVGRDCGCEGRGGARAREVGIELRDGARTSRAAEARRDRIRRKILPSWKWPEWPPRGGGAPKMRAMNCDGSA